MFSSSKRWTTVIVVAAATIVLLTLFRGYDLPTVIPKAGAPTPVYSSSCPKTPPSIPYVPPKHDRFDWRNVRVKHPLSSFKQPPTSQPHRLPHVQHQFSKPSAQALEIRNTRQATVKNVFSRGWSSYKSRAWLHDELAPVSGGFRDTFGGWGATLVDSLDTLHIMGMEAEFNEAVAAASSINFNPGSSSLETLNMFETTIRYLGGFLAAYDLTDCKEPRLLQKAVEVGDMIYAAFDTPNHMPINRWDPRKYDEDQPLPEFAIIAEMASYSLEFGRLSHLTGDPRYYDLMSRVTDLLDRQQGRTKLPGMFPRVANLRSGDVTSDSFFTLGAWADSVFEYFGKTYQLFGGLEGQYRKLYEYSMDTALQYLLFRPSLPGAPDILMSGNYHSDSGTLDAELQHLSCFAGGMFLLGGRLFENSTHLDIGKKLTDGCVWAYENSSLGIMPEVATLKACPSFEPCAWDSSQSSPYTNINDGRYILRPEAIESVYYAYRITGDEQYQETAWKMFEAIDKHTRTTYANAALSDVTTPHPAKDDSMESFWMGETLKYFYLIFSDPSLISLDEFVFNTEAHPFRVARV